MSLGQVPAHHGRVTIQVFGSSWILNLWGLRCLLNPFCKTLVTKNGIWNAWDESVHVKMGMFNDHTPYIHLYTPCMDVGFCQAWCLRKHRWELSYVPWGAGDRFFAVPKLWILSFCFLLFFGNALGERMIVVNDNHGYWMALWWSNMAGWKISFEWMFIAVKIIGRIFQPAIFDYSQGRFWYSGEEKNMANVNGSLDFFGIWQFGWLLPWVLGW